MAEKNAQDAWRAVKNDMIELVREVDALKTELSRTRDKARKDQRQLLLNLLDVLDGFDRVLGYIEPREQAAERQARIWVGNFRTVKKVLEHHLRDHGVVHIEAPEGKSVPGYHTVVETKEHLDLEDGTILEEQEKGYLWQGEVLRKSLVIAVKN